jgi:hypothetical protein
LAPRRSNDGMPASRYFSASLACREAVLH